MLWATLPLASDHGREKIAIEKDMAEGIYIRVEKGLRNNGKKRMGGTFHFSQGEPEYGR